jgi:DNA-binding MarR family transcriptional regulator
MRAHLEADERPVSSRERATRDRRSSSQMPLPADASRRPALDTQDIDLGPEQRSVLSALAETGAPRGAGVDQLSRASGFDSGRLAARLLELELGGWVERLPGGRRYRLTRRGRELCAADSRES